MRYLSDEWIAEQHRQTDLMCPSEGFECGGWTWEPPCGGCNGCLHAQTAYWIQKERERAYMFQRAGFEYADPSVIQLDQSLPGGYAPYHGEGGYHCWTAEEIDAPIFPWNRKESKC